MRTCRCKWHLLAWISLFTVAAIATAFWYPNQSSRPIVLAQTQLEIRIPRLIAWAFWAEVGLRLIISLLRTHELVFESEKDRPRKKKREISLPAHDFKGDGFWCTLIKDFLGCHPSAKIKDFFLPSILGLIELLIYPALIAVGNWTAIGGWLTIKTVARWEMWGKDRNTYNRFLIGNGLVILIAIIISSLTSIIKVDL